ncbi:hypothetical protein [Streptomyces sp. NPDC056670]
MTSTVWFGLSNLKITADRITAVDAAHLLATKPTRDTSQSIPDQRP